jgi:hypothetical protein
MESKNKYHLYLVFKIHHYMIFILISHSRGYVCANVFVFGNLYYKHILGYVNIDSGKSDEEFKLYLKNNKEKYHNIKNDDLLLYFAN